MAPGSLSSGAARVAVALDGERIWVVLIAAAVATIIAGYVSKGAFLVVAALLLVVFAYVTFRAPRTILALLVFIPLVDRYLIKTFVADPYQTIATFVSEGLLAFVVAAVFVQGRRQGRLVDGFRHPVTALLAAFLVVALLSTLVNGVRPVVAGLGIETTLDGFIVFYLARILGFDLRAGILALGIFTGIAVLAGVLAMAQVILAPDVLGLVTFTGRFGEGQRPGAIFIGEPNMLAAVLGMAIPFAAFASAKPGLTRRVRAIGMAALFILLLGLIFTFSRGTWLAVAIAILVIGLVVDRRVLLLVIGTGAVALAVAFVVPRGILLAPGSQWSFDIGDATITRVQAISSGNDERIKYIENAIPIVLDHPLVGTGPGTYGGGIAARYGSDLYTQYTEGLAPINRTVDNYWLHILVEFGVVGAVLLLGILGWFVLGNLRGARAATGSRRVVLAAIAGATIVSALVSVTEMLLEGNTTTFSLFLFLAIATLVLGQAQGVGTSALRSADMSNQPPE
jgi:O-antigen ligase